MKKPYDLENYYKLQDELTTLIRDGISEDTISRLDEIRHKIKEARDALLKIKDRPKSRLKLVR